MDNNDDDDEDDDDDKATINYGEWDNDNDDDNADDDSDDNDDNDTIGLLIINKVFIKILIICYYLAICLAHMCLVMQKYDQTRTSTIATHAHTCPVIWWLTGHIRAQSQCVPVRVWSAKEWPDMYECFSTNHVCRPHSYGQTQYVYRQEKITRT